MPKRAALFPGLALALCLPAAAAQAAPEPAVRNAVAVCDPSGPQACIKPGSTGTDYGANAPAIPNVGAGFAASGPYAGYVLLQTIPASLTRGCAYVMNTSGAQIAIVTDDGTAAGGAAPTNAGVYALAGGSSTGAQGGTTDPQFCAFKGRVQIYAPSSGAQVYAVVW